MKPERPVIVSDNEGPITKVDNAAVSTAELGRDVRGIGYKRGRDTFKVLSAYDDLCFFDREVKLIDTLYAPGDTLKLVLPMYKAMNATAGKLVDIAERTLTVIPGVETILPEMCERYPDFYQISTSYDFFIRGAFCRRVGFNPANAFCTEVKDFDKVRMSRAEKRMVRDMIIDISQMNPIRCGASPDQVHPEDQKNYARISDYFWNTIRNMEVGSFLTDVKPLNQTRKGLVLQERIIEELGVPLEWVMYIGDSITDVQCFKLLYGKGMTVGFNASGDELFQNMSICCVAQHYQVIRDLVERFAEHGVGPILRYYRLRFTYPNGDFIETVTEKSRAELQAISKDKRGKVRGFFFGKLS